MIGTAGALSIHTGMLGAGDVARARRRSFCGIVPDSGQSPLSATASRTDLRCTMPTSPSPSVVFGRFVCEIGSPIASGRPSAMFGHDSPKGRRLPTTTRQSVPDGRHDESLGRRLSLNARLDDIKRAVCEGRQQEASRLVQEAIDGGAGAQQVLSGGLIPGMQELSSLFKDGQAFLPEILISVRAMNAGLDVLRPYLGDEATGRRGTVVLGTVEGDLHDIGKNLVAMMLRSNGFEVVDLGVDVAPVAFATAAAEHAADIVAASALLTTTLHGFRALVEAVSDAGLEGRVAVLIGGAPVTRDLADEIGAQGYAADCMLAVDEAERLISMRRTS